MIPSYFETNFLFDDAVKLISQRYKLTGDCKFNINAEFIQALETAFTSNQQFDDQKFNQFELEEVLGYLEKTHQLYLYKKIPEIGQTIYNLRQNYHESHPLLQLLDLFFSDYSQHLCKHIQEEEDLLFGYVKTMIDYKKGKISDFQLYKALNSYNLHDYLANHSDTEIDLKNVRKSLLAYQPSPTNESPYRIILSQLQALELDLNIHACMEEKVFIPKALALENELKNQLKLMSWEN
jgi:regulator of cell morphogenesis and NO signaling